LAAESRRENSSFSYLSLREKKRETGPVDRFTCQGSPSPVGGHLHLSGVTYTCQGSLTPVRSHVHMSGATYTKMKMKKRVMKRKT